MAAVGRRRPRPAAGRVLPRRHSSAPSTDLAGWLREGWRVVVVTEGHGPGAADRRGAARRGRRRPARREPRLPGLEADVVHVTTGSLETGLRLRRAAPRRAHRGRPDRPTQTVDPRHAPAAVAAAQHDRPARAAAGRLSSCTSSTASAVTSRWCSARVAGGDARVPGHRVRPEQARPARRPALRPDRRARPGHQVRRRRGAHASTSWAAPTGPRRKGRARKAVSEIAAELIRLYAARMATPGHAFGAGHALAARARGRLRLRRDARPAGRDRRGQGRHGDSRIPMDRVICGDVGYGKTEIAVRAAFKAVQDGKQVAILVPTTLLAQQHFADLHRAVRAVPGRRSGRCRASRPTRRPRRRRPAWPTARSTSSSARTGCCSRPSGSRTSAWWSSTRSSGSASSTRST